MIRPFQRLDREQLAALVNSHIAAVVPGASVSVNALMSQLEREPGEPIVDPWVSERRTLVAVERDGIAAGAHLLRYGDDDSVGASYRKHAEIRWLVCRHDRLEAGAELIAAAIDTMLDWRPSRLGADGALPAPFVYGVPSTWPHVRGLYADAGFVPSRVELLLVAPVADLPDSDLQLSLRRSVGHWTRLTAAADGRDVGFIELETDFTAGGTLSRFDGWADIGNLVGDDEVKTWLLAQAKVWLQLGGNGRLVAYADEDDPDLPLYARCGFRELVRTERGWARAPAVQRSSAAR
jgi:hypothetical protein